MKSVRVHCLAEATTAVLLVEAVGSWSKRATGPFVAKMIQLVTWQVWPHCFAFISKKENEIKPESHSCEETTYNTEREWFVFFRCQAALCLMSFLYFKQDIRTVESYFCATFIFRNQEVAHFHALAKVSSLQLHLWVKIWVTVHCVWWQYPKHTLETHSSRQTSSRTQCMTSDVALFGLSSFKCHFVLNDEFYFVSPRIESFTCEIQLSACYRSHTSFKDREAHQQTHSPHYKHRR